MKKIIAAVVVVALAAGAWFYFRSGGEAGHAPAKQGVPVSVAPAAKGDVPFELSAVGSVVPIQSVAVRARVDSQLIEVKFKDGDEVKQGDLLFVLDDRATKAQVGQLEANLVRERAALDNAKRQYDRKKGLHDKGFETGANFDDARAQLDSAEAAVAADTASIDNLRAQLEYTKITAPISGRTGTINVTVGNTVKANDATPLVTINQMRPIRVQVSLPQKNLDAVRQALAAGTVEVAAAHEGAKTATPSIGRLDYIDNSIDAATGTFIARATFPNDDEALWPGMFVRATVRLGAEKGALTVPEVAIQHSQDADFVFVVAGGKAAKRPVKVERMQSDLAVIADGLKEGEQVVTDGALKLENGSAVSLPDSASPKQDKEKH
jgi:multidrug efflux system membrane fusion protein